jgi:hypothetical protein
MQLHHAESLADRLALASISAAVSSAISLGATCSCEAEQRLKGNIPCRLLLQRLCVVGGPAIYQTSLTQMKS